MATVNILIELTAFIDTVSRVHANAEQLAEAGLDKYRPAADELAAFRLKLLDHAGKIGQTVNTAPGFADVDIEFGEEVHRGLTVLKAGAIVVDQVWESGESYQTIVKDDMDEWTKNLLSEMATIGLLVGQGKLRRFMNPAEFETELAQAKQATGVDEEKVSGVATDPLSEVSPAKTSNASAAIAAAPGWTGSGWRNGALDLDEMRAPNTAASQTATTAQNFGSTHPAKPPTPGGVSQVTHTLDGLSH